MTEQTQDKEIIQKLNTMPSGTELTLTIDQLNTDLMCTLIGIEEGKHIIIKLLDEKQIKPFLPEQHAVAKYLSDGIVYSFKTQILSVISHPSVLIFIDYPDSIRQHNIRSHKRIDCLLPNKIIIEGNTIESTIVNISRGGCKLLIKNIEEGEDSPFKYIDKDIIVILSQAGNVDELRIPSKVVSAYRVNIENYFGIKFQIDDEDIRNELDYYLQTIEKIETSKYFQTAVNSILKISTKSISYIDQLNYILTIILSVPQLSIQTKGAIYLIENDPDLLILKAHIRIPRTNLEECSTVHVGKCLCGHAASTGETIHGDCNDPRHDKKHLSDEINSHYCIPIKNFEKVLGVLHLYVRPDHKIDQNEEDFLVSISNILAGMISKWQTEAQRIRLFQELKKTNEQLIKSQEQLVQTQKMASLGQLVSGVAHEINTPLGVGVTVITKIRTLSQKIKDSIDNNTLKKSDMQKYIDDVQQGSNLIFKNLERLGELIQNFKLVAASQKQDKMIEYNLRQKLNQIIELHRKKINENSIEVTILCPKNLIVKNNPESFTTVITNLLSNSINHAFAGVIQRDILIAATEVNSNIIIQFSDNGRGIYEDDLKNIFEPFFTTDRGSGNVGLGLNIVYNIVHNALNGTISCVSMLEKGATFMIKFPKNI